MADTVNPDPDTAGWWNAVMNGDERYDCVFLYGVTTTGIFCRPSLQIQNPAPEPRGLFYQRV